MAVGRLFGITENNVRVALARLQDRGRLQRLGRGRYGLAADARPVQRHVSAWASLEERRVSWRGRWCGVYLSRPGQVGRLEGRRRMRALEFLGLRALEAGLWLRPDNLAGGVAALRTRLVELGLDEGSRVFALSDLDPDTEQQARGLWDVQGLVASYGAQTRRLQQSAKQLAKLPLEESVVESFLVGGRAINQLAFDPLLPDEIQPAVDRRALVEEMRAYDRLARAYWRDYATRQDIPEIVMPSERSLHGGAIPGLNPGG